MICVTWVLETEHSSSAKEANTLNTELALQPHSAVDLLFVVAVVDDLITLLFKLRVASENDRIARLSI